jgi:hypothetical protein
VLKDFRCPPRFCSVLHTALRQGDLRTASLPIVALTPRGKDLIGSAFRKHAGQIRRVFSELSLEELRGLDTALKKVGKRAAALLEES